MENIDHQVKTVVNRMRVIRIEKGLSQLELANMAGLSQSFYSSIESHKKIPTLKTLIRIASALQVTPGAFFQDSDPTKEEIKENVIRYIREHL